MPRVLAVADEVREFLYGPGLKELDVDLIVSCGDLPFDYLEYLVTVLSVPLLYVPGNHDPGLRGRPLSQNPLSPMRVVPRSPGPQGCTNIDGRLIDVAGLRIGGLGGSVRYSRGPNQYTQNQMRARALRLELRARLKRRFLQANKIDVFCAHMPAFGVGDADDPPHHGFTAFHRLVRKLRPNLVLHGHVHPLTHGVPELDLYGSRVVNCVGYRVLEV